MKTSITLAVMTIVAAAALTARRFVTTGGAVPAAGAWCPGIANADYAAGEAAGVVTHGVELVEAGGAVSVDAVVETDNSGRAVALSTGIGLGRALDASTAAGQFIRVKLS